MAGLGRNSEDMAIVHAVTTLAHTLGLSVIADQADAFLAQRPVLTQVLVSVATDSAYMNGSSA